MWTHPLPLAVHLVVAAPPRSLLLTAAFLLATLSLHPLAPVPPRLGGHSPTAFLALLSALPVRAGPPVLRLPAAASAPTASVVVAPGWPLLVTGPRDGRGVQPAMGAVVVVVVVLALAAPPAVCGLSPLQRRAHLSRASSSAAASHLLPAVLVEPRLPVQLVHQVVLAKAKVRVAASCHLVGVVVAVLQRVNH